MPFSLPKGQTRILEAFGEGVGFDLPSLVDACVSRKDVSRVETCQGCRFSQTLFSSVQTHPRALSDVTHSAFGPHGLCNVYELIFPLHCQARYTLSPA